MAEIIGIERFFDQVKPEEVIDEVILTIRSQENKGYPLTPLSALSLIYLRQGQFFLKEVTTYLYETYGYVPEPTELPNLINDPEYMTHVKINEYAIAFGATLHTLEQTLINKSCSLQEYANFYNLATDGTYLPKSTLSGEEPLADQTWKEMLITVQADLSLSEFFITRKGRNTLPNNLQGVLYKDPQFMYAVNSCFIRPHQTFKEASDRRFSLVNN